MSNSQYLGTNAGFYYTRQSASTWDTFALPVPLRDPRPSVRASLYVADSLDLSQRQTFLIRGSSWASANEYVARIRYNDDQTGLVEFLHHAALQSGSTVYPLRYTTALTTGTSSGAMGAGADVWLIEPTAPVIDTMMDSQRGSFGDLEVTVRLRTAVVGGTFTTASGARWF